MALQLAMLYVKDMAKMVAFYEDALGLPVRSRSENWVEFDGFALHLTHADFTISSPPEIREETPYKLIFTADVAKLEALGVTLLRRPWGGCDGVDPEGNVFGIA